MRGKAGPVDFGILITILLLLGIGLIMVFSASALTSSYEFKDSFYYLKRQLVWAGIGLGVMFLALQWEYTRWRRLAFPLLGFTLLSLVLVLLIGSKAGESSRWLGWGGIKFQPSEMAKFTLVVFMAASLDRHQKRLVSFWQGVAPYLVLLALVGVLILLQPDLGTALAIGATVYLLLAVGGARPDHLAFLAAAALGAVALAIKAAPYRMARFTAFLNPWADPHGFGWQTIQSLLAIGSGGLLGTGLGFGRQKLYYLPENHTDFIFSVLSEELGFLGAGLVVVLFLILIWRGFRVAFKAPDNFARLLAAGLTIMLAVQVLINMGMTTGLLPVTGIPLPLLSYGGSSLLFTLLSLGVLLNISRYVKA
ncbi:MAG TPA: putative lipid II flippase FtsW [Moorella mulderi]|nr:putative lipid II flippase FtsW [Moorella mulderi]